MFNPMFKGETGSKVKIAGTFVVLLLAVFTVASFYSGGTFMTGAATNESGEVGSFEPVFLVIAVIIVLVILALIWWWMNKK